MGTDKLSGTPARSFECKFDGDNEPTEGSVHEPEQDRRTYRGPTSARRKNGEDEEQHDVDVQRDGLLADNHTAIWIPVIAVPMKYRRKDQKHYRGKLAKVRGESSTRPTQRLRT